MRGLFLDMGRVFIEAIVITGATGALALAINFVHPERIPFVAEADYEILVPCPEPGGEVEPLDPTDPAVQAESSFVIDARARAAHSSWTYRKAVNVPFDYLDPTPEEKLKELAAAIARSKAQKVVVFGDGELPDTGEQLGKEISGFGIKNVHFVRGGAPALGQPASAEATP